MDVCTQWNSTLDMLSQLIMLQRPIDEFLLFYNSAAGKKEFKGIKTVLPCISDEKWAVLHGLCFLLSSLGKASEILSGEQYSTFVSAMPVLRQLMHDILDPDLFNYRTKTLSKTKQPFFDTYESMSFFGSVTGKPDVCRKLLVEQSNAQFNAMDLSVLCSSLLDPRFGLTSMHWKREKEKEFAKKRLIEEVITLDWEEDTKIFEVYLPESEKSCMDEDFSFDFTKPSAQLKPSSDANDQLDILNIHVTHEVQLYLLGIQSLQNPKPLNWWSVNRMKHPLVAKAARKWLSVPATSTPSERVFSICGIVDAAKRALSCLKSLYKFVNYDLKSY
jgi:hAT family C-terminal dimerisation region